MSTQIVSRILAVLVIASQIFSVCVLVALVFYRKCKNMTVVKFFFRHGIGFAFAVALVSTGGSLYYSEIVGFEPCYLCWFQRVFIYPQVALLGLALIKKDSNVVDYSLTLLSVGAAISLYHNYIFYVGQRALVCGVDGRISCLTPYVLEFGYVTLPLMALSAFAVMIVLLTGHKLINR